MPKRRSRPTSSPADDDDRPRAHVLLLADHPLDAVAPGRRRTPRAGCSSRPSAIASRRRGHRRRQVDEPPRVDGEAAHDLEGGDGVLLADRHRAGEPGLDDPLADDVVEVEVGRLAAARRRRPRGSERLGRLVVHLGGRDGDELALGVAQGGEPPAEDTAGVDADRPVEPHRPRAPACGRRRPWLARGSPRAQG